MISYLLLRNSSTEIVASSEAKLIHSSELIQLEFEKYLQELKYDIMHLANSPFLQQYIENPSASNRILLSDEYLSVLNSKPHYFQIRFIDSGSKGRELIRADRAGDSTFIVTEKNLQNKGNREYFIESVGLPHDSLYNSEIDLNKEYGEISEPATPTLRVAVPVLSDDRTAGIIVINSDLSLLFNSLRSITGKTTGFYILNNKGFYLYHPQEEKRFEFEFNRPSSFLKEFDKLPGELSDNSLKLFDHNDAIVLLRPISYPRPDYGLFLMLSANRNKILASYYQWRNKSFFIIASLCGIFLILAFLILRRQAKDLRSIIDRIKKFSHSPSDQSIRVRRKDEIGELADSFNEMAGMISTNIHLLEKEKERAELAVQEKEEFLENMSHEIRNPLQSILGLTEMLSRNKPEKHQIELLNSLKFNTANLQSLVNDILDYKLLLRKEISLKPEWFGLNSFLEEIKGSHAFYASEKKIHLKKEISEELIHAMIYSDPSRLSQIMNNLTSNAIKYTPPGGMVKISAMYDGTTEGRAGIQFSVSDNGPGIDDALIDKIQNRYVSNINGPQFADSFGLGLNIVSELLGYFDSELKIKSAREQGSVFCFRILSELRDSEQENEDYGYRQEELLLQLSALVIDDDPQITKLYKHILSDRFRELDIVMDPEKLQSFIHAHKSYDIIITDYKLSGKIFMDYKSELHTLLNENSPIFLVTAAHPDMKAFEKEFPAIFFINKPFKPDKLRGHLLEKYIQQRYGRPDIKSIKEDYDFQKDKYAKAIDILISELQLMSKSLQLSVVNNDKAAVHDIRHKMVTTIRRLQLFKFEKWLENLDTRMEGQNTSLIQEEIKTVISYFVKSVRRQV